MHKTGKGVFPEQIKDVKNSNVVIQKVVYLFGGSKVLQYDAVAHKITEVKTDPSIRIPVRCQCEYLPKENKVVLVGGTVDGKITKTCLMFSPPNFAQAQKLPDFPKPIRYCTTATFNGVLYAVGGETEAKDPEGISIEVWSLKINPVDAAWKKVCDLPIPRKSPNLAIIGNNMYVFGGNAGKGNRTTQIDSIDLTTKVAKKETFRLPLGVEGARLAWHGDNILIIGGKRTTDAPDANVLMIDFTNQAIISVRDLNVGRDFPLIIPQKIDEIVVIGGGSEKSAEMRSWDKQTNDYVFKKTTVTGMELIENPTHYDSALPAFVDNTPTKDTFPKLESGSRMIFGNEIDCFLIEVPESLTPCFYMSPMKLQQKTGQATLRLDANTIILAGGTDVTRKKLSSKTYRFSQNNGTIEQLASLNEARYAISLVQAGTSFYVLGGKGSNQTILASVEKLTHAKEKEENWEVCAPMPQARFGHVTWTDGTKIYVIGGSSAKDGKPLADCLVYDTATDKWTTHTSFKMNPALHGASKYETSEWIYLVGGHGPDSKASTVVFKVNKKNPTQIEKATDLKAPRVGALVMKVGKHIVVIGGSDTHSIEAFDESWKPVSGMDSKSESFFAQLACYTSDLKLENCSVG